jgi:transcriptional regulator with XRE-family HTH domain
MLTEMTDRAVVAEIGRRVAAHRVAMRLNQNDLAERAGVGRSTVQRIESGESIQLLSLVKILRALGRMEGLDVLLPSSLRTPLLDLERERSRQRRVRHSRGREETRDGDGEAWTWGDEGGT